MSKYSSLGSLLLAGVVLLAVAAPLDASTRPPQDSARSTRPPSSSPSGGSAGSSGSASPRSVGSRSSGSQAVSRAPSPSPPRHGAGATRPPVGSGGGVVERREHGGGGGGGGDVIIHPRWWDSHWYFGFGLGRPWGYYWGPYDWHAYGWWGGPWYGYGPAPRYGYGYPRDVRYQEPGAIDLNVKPKHTEVYLDGELIGSAGRFDGFPDYLWITPGSHEIVLYRDGFVTQRRVVDVRPAWVVDLRIALAPGEAISPDQVSRPLEDGDGDEGWRERY